MTPLPHHPFFTENDLFVNAFHHAAIGMALVSLEGGFLEVNKSLCELLDHPEDALKRLTFQEITHPDDLDFDMAQVHRLLAGHIHSYTLEKRYFTRLGNIVWTNLSVSLVRDTAGEPLFFISQIQDITVHKRAERQRDTFLDDLSRSLEEKERLLAELQHSQSEITNLRSKLLTICAWTKRVRFGDQWMSVDEFLTKELGLKLTHGMSAEGAEVFRRDRA